MTCFATILLTGLKLQWLGDHCWHCHLIGSPLECLRSNKPWTVLAFIKVHCQGQFLTRFQKGALHDWKLWTALARMKGTLRNFAVWSAFPCASRNLVFSSLLHRKSVSSFCSMLGTRSSAEKGSAKSWTVLCLFHATPNCSAADAYL